MLVYIDMKQADSDRKLKPEPCILIIAGITGNLAKKYLLPALYDLIVADMLPDNFKIVGLSRRDIETADLLRIIEDDLGNKRQKVNKKALLKMTEMLHICLMNISKPQDYKILREDLDKIEDDLGLCMHRLYYLAIPPQIFGPVIDGLGTFGLNKGCQHGSTESRLLLEKPFGFDLASAKELVGRLNNSFSEDQIYRVDHYLAKENAQNILTFRFENPLFSRIWDRNSIEYITITAAETIGIEDRADFYDQIGALRDFVQSHLLQLLCLATIEEPADRSAESLHKEKVKLLNSVAVIKQDEVASRAVRGQYEGYAAEVGNPKTTTETFAALRLQIDNERWRGVPILLRHGKAMTDKITEINFKLHDRLKAGHPPSILTIRIQPDEGIVLSLVAKKPGFDSQTQTAQMQFCYDQHFADALPNAYEYVLVDALRGDRGLFPTADEVIRSWEIIENVVQAWTHNEHKPEIYEVGSQGPESAKKLAMEVGASWETHQLKVC
ncbi:glucose-6-phosphate dehydrogenase [Candidatus Parcubacteria bacterium]|nr:glucose-6-phosphate dehydrogenase [Candidatus Parcubacteria bacterium]